MHEFQDSTIKAEDGCQLFVRYYPGREELPLVIICHGMSEHGGRYQKLNHDLQDKGVSTINMDMRGHGKSGGPRCYFPSSESILDDFSLLFSFAKEKKPNSKIYLFGHSMGGLLSSYFLLKSNPENVHGIILASPAFQDQLKVHPLLEAATPIASKLFPKLRAPLPFDISTVSSDPNVEQEILADPLYFKGGITARMGQTLRIIQKDVCNNIEQMALPSLVLLGEADPIVDVSATKKLFEVVNMEKNQVKVFPEAKHELINEPCYELVFHEILLLMNLE